MDDALLLRTSGGEGHMHCLALRSERGLAGNRLAYTVRVPADEETDPRARLVIVAFTKRKVLENGCVEVEIPERPAGGATKRLRGYIDFVPARNEAGTAKERG